MAFSIKELESLSGIKAHTIRIWEQRYDFLKPSRTQTNIRTYSNEELKTILTVALLNKYGYKISRINEMLPEQRTQAVLELPKDEAYNEHLVNQLIGHMIDMDSYAFEAVLDKHIREFGIEHAVTGLVFYFMEKVGILWQTSRINPAQEHIVSNIIRQKIIAAIEGLPCVQIREPLYLMFLPEDEFHEIGLLYVFYHLRKNGRPVIYLGANVPLKDALYLYEAKKPRYIYLHLTVFPRKQQFEKFLNAISVKMPESTILFSGTVTQFYRKPLPPNAVFLKSFAEVNAYILNH